MSDSNRTIGERRYNGPPGYELRCRVCACTHPHHMMHCSEHPTNKRADTIRACLDPLADAVRYFGGGAEAGNNTPKRFLKALEEMTAGRLEDPKEILSKQFDEHSDELIVLRDVDFTSVCEHHLLPFVGTAHVAYLPGPGGKVVGLSKLARLVDCFARRLQLQERMTKQIATALVEHLNARGAAVVVKAHHSCMGCRGVKKPGAVMVTSCTLGAFREDAQLRNEFLVLCGGG